MPEWVASFATLRQAVIALRNCLRPSGVIGISALSATLQPRLLYPSFGTFFHARLGVFQSGVVPIAFGLRQSGLAFEDVGALLPVHECHHDLFPIEAIGFG